MRFLQAAGWTILAHRFRAGRHDVDLIARRADVVAFIEVKTRSGPGFGAPEEAVSWRKRRTLAWAAAVWVARHGQATDRYRFDVISVISAGEWLKTIHIEDAWRP